MTDGSTGGGPNGPPWSVDALADLHGGVLDAEQSARLWPRVNADPQARAVIDALDRVKVELGWLRTAPAAPMPAQFAAKLDASMRAEAMRAAGTPAPVSPPMAPVTDLADARRRRNRKLVLGAGLLTAAAAAVAVTIAVFPSTDTTGGSPYAASAPAAKPPLPVDRGNLSAAIGGVNKERDYGPLKDQQGLDTCLRANDIDPTTVQTMGVRQVTIEGRPGIFALLTTGELGRFRVLIVQPDCGPGHPGKIVNTLLPGG
ncbi:MAG: hypothetical protein ACJ72N_18815 [Labedaea sp.]